MSDLLGLPDVFPRYVVKQPAVKLSRMEALPWDLWKQPAESRMWICLGAYATPELARAAAAEDQAFASS